MTTKVFFGVLAIMILVAGSAALFRKNSMDSSNPSACTEEALVCPDGTSVGRTGEMCAFAACPTIPAYTGKLTQQDGKFFLVVGATAPGEVSYSMPLDIKVSNVLGQIVGQQVTVRGAFTDGNTYKVENLEELSGATNAGNSAVVGIGQTIFINGVNVTLNAVAQDNRCPTDVQCIEAGAITANVTFKSNTDKETFNMASDEVPHAFDSYKISIVNVSPSRVAAQAPDPKAYKVTFKVEDNRVDDVMFTGTIKAFSTGCFADGICSVTVDNKVVIITVGWRADRAVGKLIGVPSIGDLEKKIGTKATVFAHKNSETEYTLYGNSDYYVKVQ